MIGLPATGPVSFTECVSTALVSTAAVPARGPSARFSNAESSWSDLDLLGERSPYRLLPHWLRLATAAGAARAQAIVDARDLVLELGDGLLQILLERFRPTLRSILEVIFGVLNRLEGLAESLCNRLLAAHCYEVVSYGRDR